jgi:GNAT superfamily N-acetyltransferase
MGHPEGPGEAHGNADGADTQPFVRRARLADAEAFAAVQHRGWARASEHDVLPPPPPLEEMRQAWERSITVPPSARHHSWVAVDRAAAGEVVRGIAASTPASDPDLDAEHCVDVVVLTVDPAVRGRGHGSRLIAAAMDVAVDEGALEAVAWVAVDDDSTRRFLQSCGWAADGAFRTLGADGADGAPEAELRQVRLATSLRGEDPPGPGQP